MNKKQKIELAIISGLFLLGLTGIFLAYRQKPENPSLSHHDLLVEPMAWSQAEEYRLEKDKTGTRVSHQLTSFEMVFPPNWSVEILSDKVSSENVSVRALTEGSSWDQNQIIREGCSIDFGFAYAPLRHQLAEETIADLGSEILSGIGKKRVITVSSTRGILRSSVAQNGHYFADITAPLNNSYLLDASLVFSEDHRLECQKQILELLAEAKIR